MTSSAPPAVKRGSWVRFLPLLIVFVVCGFTSCFAITLAAQGEITISTGSAPDQVLRIWLVMEARQRGIGISRGSAVFASENAVAVTTTVDYLLWQGEGEATEYCLFYLRTDAQSEWVLTENRLSPCTSP